MSKVLYWRPVTNLHPVGGGVGHPTKGLVAKLLFDHDGGLGGFTSVSVGSSDYHYLRGARDATTFPDVRSDLSELLAAIELTGTAEVWIDE